MNLMCLLSFIQDEGAKRCKNVNLEKKKIEDLIDRGSSNGKVWINSLDRKRS